MNLKRLPLRVIIWHLLRFSFTCSQNCDPTGKYRPLDGVCNNLEHPYWGSSPRSHDSLSPLSYSDGKICPREAKKGTPSLPLARDLSYHIMYRPDKPDDPNDLTETHIYFGMFLTHDISLSFSEVTPRATYNCPGMGTKCPIAQMYTGRHQNPPFYEACIMMEINLGLYCNETNIKECGCKTCPNGQYQQTNFMTPAIDLSNIYGIDSKRNKEVRLPGSAKFRLTADDLLPLSTNTTLHCRQANQSVVGVCLDTAESQGNIAPNLQVMHTVFVRFHNYLVDNLKGIFFEQETLFEEARRINIAIMQLITYRDYLPTIFGTCMTKNLEVPSKRYMYDPSLDFTLMKEFVHGAFRFGHTQPKNFATVGFNNETISLGRLYSLSPYVTSGPDVIDKMMYGTLKDRAKTSDLHYVDQTVNHLTFSLMDQPSDLAAVDVQRGRLDGVNPYGVVRQQLGLSVPKSYEDLAKLIPEMVVEKLKKYYGDDGIGNLDFYLAGLAEKKEANCKGILIGNTFRIIIEDQFRKAKFGDRFWYERLDQPWSFTKAQLSEIEKITLSGIICATTNLTNVLENALIATSREVSCADLRQKTKINFELWKERGKRKAQCGMFDVMCFIQTCLDYVQKLF